MNVLYDKNGVLIALSPTILRFGNYQLPTTSSNRRHLLFQLSHRNELLLSQRGAG